MNEKETRVLIAIDDSKYSQVVIEEAAKKTWPQGTQFLVLHVVAIPTGGHWQDFGLPVEEKLRLHLIKDGQRLVEDSVEYLRPQLGKDIQISGRVVEGHAVEKITDEAKDWNANLIMMGTHGRTGVLEFLLGSVAAGVLRSAACSVEVVRTQLKEQEVTAPKAQMTLIF